METSASFEARSAPLLYPITAYDPRLDRQVAIKVLPPDLTRDDTAKQRFLQEAKAASALDHPNICTIYEINETADGQLYLVMAHYEGETLKERIERGALVLDDAVDIATQVGRGLAEAHGAGIVHRDIKPANLLIAKGGMVKILDFGLAKLAGAEGVTQTGTTVGTVAYMSPEQARGEEVDHRTDIWSLGVVLYEMLSGRPPFQGENLLAISDAISSDPGPLSGHTSTANSAVTRALSKDVGKRYQAVADMIDALREVRTVVAGSTGGVESPPDAPSIAVLPFADMSPEKDQDYFCEGLAEELIDALARLEGLRVVARTSAFRFKGDALDLRDVGEKLNVKTVLEGSVRKAGNRLRINAQLIDTQNGFHIWSERFSRELDDVFAVQEEIAATVAARMNLTLAQGEGARRRTKNLDAHDAYLKGRFLLHQQLRMNEALDSFRHAVRLDPDYAVAHAGLAEVYGLLGDTGGLAPAEAARQSTIEASRALELDPNLAEAHVTLAWTHTHYKWDWATGEQHFKRALVLDPASADAHARYACYLSWVLGQVDEAVAEGNRAIDLDPMNPMMHHWLGVILSIEGRSEQAIARLHKAAELDPASWFLHSYLGASHRLLTQYDIALDEGRTAVTLSGRHPWAVAELGLSLAASGDAASARTLRDELVGRFREEHGAPIHVAALCGALGDTEDAFAFLERGYRTRDAWCVHLRRVQYFDPLRADPRFQALLRRMNFPEPAAAG